MDIILDTNIYIRDLTMESNNFDILFDYLNKTNSNIILPQVVYQELKAVYKRKLEERYKDYKNSKNVLEKILLTDNEIETINLNLNKKVNLYIDFLLDKINVNKRDVVSYKSEYLKEIVKRASERKKPFSEKGEEFRDALLWLTIIDIAKESKNKELIFISKNTKDFAHKTDLHPDLVSETETNGIKINYFNSLKHFIKYHASNISYINLKWIENKLKEYDVNNQLIGILNDDAYDDLVDWLTWNDHKPGGYVDPLYIDLEVSNFFVYKMIDESIHIKVELIGEIEMEAEIEVEKLIKKKEIYYDYINNPETGKLVTIPVNNKKEYIDTSCECQIRFYTFDK